MVNELGDTVWPGARQHWRPTSPKFLEYALKLVKRLAERYGDHPALVAWHVNNELGNHNQFDFSADAIRSFRVHLQKRYKNSIDALNTAWETAFWSQRYSTFDEILPPRTCPRGTFPNPSHVLDWRRFTSDVLVEYYMEERNVLRSITPDIPITTNLITMGKQTKDRDYTKWVNELDFVSNDHYVFISEQGRDELSFSASLTSGVSSHKPWFLMEHSTSAVQWQRVNTPKSTYSRHSKPTHNHPSHILHNGLVAVFRGDQGTPVATACAAFHLDFQRSTFYQDYILTRTSNRSASLASLASPKSPSTTATCP
jgi:beta-galactosidase